MLHSADSPDGPFRAGSVESALWRTEVLQGIYPGSFPAKCCSPFGRHWRICCYWSDATPLFVKLPGAPGREAKGLRHLFLEGRPLFQEPSSGECRGTLARASVSPGCWRSKSRMIPVLLDLLPVLFVLSASLDT